MRVLITGASGSLGQECVTAFKAAGDAVTGVVRESRGMPGLIEADLLDEADIALPERVDAIVHAAGNIRFTADARENERMAHAVARLAQREGVPVYFISTAFAYRPEGVPFRFNNAYEEDKYRAELALKEAGVPHALIRPSVLAGSTATGRIARPSGYYRIVDAVMEAAREARSQGRTVRFPYMAGKSDMVPVDEAARAIRSLVARGALGTHFVTNPEPPASSWVLSETLHHLDLSDAVEASGEMMEAMTPQTPEEGKLWQTIAHFAPYWSMAHGFPSSVLGRNLVTSEYLKKILAAHAHA